MHLRSTVVRVVAAAAIVTSVAATAGGAAGASGAVSGRGRNEGRPAVTVGSSTCNLKDGIHHVVEIFSSTTSTSTATT